MKENEILQTLERMAESIIAGKPFDKQGKPLNYSMQCTEANIATLTNQAVSIVRGAIGNGIIIVQNNEIWINVNDFDLIYCSLPLLPYIYPEMTHKTYDVYTNKDNKIGRVFYRGLCEQEEIEWGIVNIGYKCGFEFTEPLKTVSVTFTIE